MTIKYHVIPPHLIFSGFLGHLARRAISKREIKIVDSTHRYAFVDVLLNVSSLCRPFCIREIDICVSDVWNLDYGHFVFGDSVLFGLL